MPPKENLLTELNGVCPYFTMFPLEFPYSVLSRHGSNADWVLDPFSGRGTTNFACRLLGINSVGIDSNPVAHAITQAKIARTTPAKIMNEARKVLEQVQTPHDIPQGEFWDLAFHRDVLKELCRFREGLITYCQSDSRKALRAILMGALHGPRRKSKPAYFSNQCPRTYAPKPAYAIRFWKQRRLLPERVNVMALIEDRAWRFYADGDKAPQGFAILGDSRDKKTFGKLCNKIAINWIITSPPYYGMRTYIPDQWLRAWFLGAAAEVEYSQNGQISHRSPKIFAEELRRVWMRAGELSAPRCRMVIRFGGINDRKADAKEIISESLRNTVWKVQTIADAGSASEGKRQALHFARVIDQAKKEFDVWTIRKDE